MDGVFQFVQSEIGAAVIRGLILGGIVVLCSLVWGLDRMLRKRFAMVQEALALILTRISPSIRRRDLEGIIRRALSADEDHTDMEG